MTTAQTANAPGLLDRLSLGALQLRNRVIMSPLTRCRASEGRVPNLLMAEYYRQRASAGLILSEATAVTPVGVGYPNTPGIWSDEQTEGWRLVTEAVAETLNLDPAVIAQFPKDRPDIMPEG